MATDVGVDVVVVALWVDWKLWDLLGCVGRCEERGAGGLGIEAEE